MAIEKVRAAYTRLEELAARLEELRNHRAQERYEWVNQAREFVETSSVARSEALGQFRTMHPEPVEIAVPEEHRNPCLQLHPARVEALIAIYEEMVSENRGPLSRQEIEFFFEDCDLVETA